MAENTNITWDGTPIDEFDRDSLNLQRINENGTVQQMIEIINANFEEIARHGGGPGGVDGKDGVDGVDGLNSEYIYSNECDVITSSDAGVKYPSSNSEYSDLFYRVNNSSSHYAYYKNVKWYDHPQGVSPEKPNEYVISRYRRSVDGEWYYSEVPTIWSHWGQTGRDGDGVEYIFMSSKRELSDLELSSSILKISEMDAAQKALFNIDDFFPGSDWFVDENIDKAKSALEKAGVDIGTDVFRTRWTNCFEFCDNGFEWTDDPIGTSVENPNEYVAIRRCNTDENTGEKIWGDYSKPALWSNYSFEGRVFLIYCNTGKDEEPVAPQKGQGRWNVTENTLDLTGLPSGWTDDNLDKEDDEITWMSSGIFNHNGDNVSWSKPVCISGKDGKDGEDGTNIQFIYALSELPDYPSTRAMQEELFDAVEAATTNPKYSIYEYTKWFDRAQPISPTDRTEYMWARRRDKETDPWEYDPMPIIWAHWGEDGTDGDGVEYIFTTTDEYIEDDDVELSAELSLPKYEALNTEQKKLFQIDDFVPSKYWFEKKKNGVYSNKAKAEEALERTISDSEWQGCFGFNVYPGWTDNPISISPYEPYQWVSIRRSTADEFDGKRFWEDFSTPVLWNSYGKGTRVFVVYCNIDGNDTPKRPEGGYWYNLGGENKLVNSKEDYADYKCNALEDGTPDYSSYVGYWNDKNIDVDGTISWMSSGVFTEDGENISWSEPFRITGPAGMNGMDGSNETYVYALSDVEPVCPINGTYQEKLDFFTNVENADPEEWTENPNGYTYTDPVTQKTTVWYDNPQGIENEDGKRTEWVWVKTLPANATQETLWNFAPKPIIWAHWGEDGTDGDGVEYIFYKSTEKSQNDTLPVNMKPVKKEETYDESIFRNGQGYDPTQKTVSEEENPTTLAYAAPHGFDPSKIGAPDEKNYIPTEEPEPEKKEEEQPVEEETKVQETPTVPTEEAKPEERADVVTEKFNPFVAAGGTDDKYANPVYVEEEKETTEDEIPTISVNPFSTFKLLFESIFKPVSKLPNNARAIDDAIDSGKLVVFSTIYVAILAVIGAVVGGFFVKRYDLSTGLYTTYLDFGNVVNVKYVDVVLSAGAVSLLLTLVTAIVYYIISFFRSKGVTLGSYISLCSMALFPLYFGIFTLYPILSIFSYFAGFFILIISFIFSLLTLFNGITTLIKFDKPNNKIFYNIFTMSIVVLILIGILMVFFQNDFNSIVNIINAM